MRIICLALYCTGVIVGLLAGLTEHRKPVSRYADLSAMSDVEVGTLARMVMRQV